MRKFGEFKKLGKTIAMAAISTSLVFASAVTALAKAQFGFTKGAVRYEVGMDGAEALKTLGKARSTRDVNACANGYVNRAYTFGEKDNDFEVYIELVEGTGKDEIASITLMSANVATEEGLKVGDTAEQVMKIYPAAQKGLGSYKVVSGQEEIEIKMRGNTVSYISYRKA